MCAECGCGSQGVTEKFCDGRTDEWTEIISIVPHRGDGGQKFEVNILIQYQVMAQNTFRP